MPIDPQIQIVLDRRATLPAVHTLTVAEARAQFKVPKPPGIRAAEVASAVDRIIDGPGGPMVLRVYTPLRADGPLPILLYFHGGGFVMCDLDTHDPTCRNLCAGAGCVVISVDYRLGPEHRFPAAPDDCFAALRWVAMHGGGLGWDTERIAVAGDSAGANLATVTALQTRDAGGPRLAGQLLVYPATDAAFEHQATVSHEVGHFLRTGDVPWFWGNYLHSADDAHNPYASPLRANTLRGLPPALVILAELDPLHEEGMRYALRLRDADVPTVLSRYDGVIHGFFSFAGLVTKADEAQTEACQWLRRILNTD